MNKTFRIVWSHAHQAYVVAHEKAKARGKPSSSRRGVVALTVSLLGFSSIALAEPALNALPTGGQIVAGSGSISQTGSAMTVN